jgi:hypothetical protein
MCRASSGARHRGGLGRRLAQWTVSASRLSTESCVTSLVALVQRKRADPPDGGGRLSFSTAFLATIRNAGALPTGDDVCWPRGRSGAAICLLGLCLTRGQVAAASGDQAEAGQGADSRGDLAHVLGAGKVGEVDRPDNEVLSADPRWRSPASSLEQSWSWMSHSAVSVAGVSVPSGREPSSASRVGFRALSMPSRSTSAPWPWSSRTGSPGTVNGPLVTGGHLPCTSVPASTVP